jgi:hypothetical protein
MTMTDTGPRASVPAGPAGSRYRTPVTLVLSTAFTLSAGFTATLAAADLLPAGLTDAHPLIWAYHLVGFGAAALARTDWTWVWWLVTAVVTAYVVIGLQLYTVLLVPGLLTTIGWFANDIHLGLLVLAGYLCIRRLTSAVP